jgi:hypothetical protein
MNFDNYIQELENEYKFLQSHIAVTDENWRDFLKEKFFNENLNQLPIEYIGFNSELQNLNQSFKSAENIINSLK